MPAADSGAPVAPIAAAVAAIAAEPLNAVNPPVVAIAHPAPQIVGELPVAPPPPYDNGDDDDEELHDIEDYVGMTAAQTRVAFQLRWLCDQYEDEVVQLCSQLGQPAPKSLQFAVMHRLATSIINMQERWNGAERGEAGERYRRRIVFKNGVSEVNAAHQVKMKAVTVQKFLDRKSTWLDNMRGGLELFEKLPEARRTTLLTNGVLDVTAAGVTKERMFGAQSWHDYIKALRT